MCPLKHPQKYNSSGEMFVPCISLSQSLRLNIFKTFAVLMQPTHQNIYPHGVKWSFLKREGHSTQVISLAKLF